MGLFGSHYRSKLAGIPAGPPLAQKKGLFGQGIFTRDNARILGGALQDLDGGFGTGNLDRVDERLAAQEQNQNRLQLLGQLTKGLPTNQSALAQLYPQVFAKAQIANHFPNPIDQKRVENSGKFADVAKLNADTAAGRLTHDIQRRSNPVTNAISSATASTPQVNEGTRIRNPQTGETMVLSNGQWVQG